MKNTHKCGFEIQNYSVFSPPVLLLQVICLLQSQIAGLADIRSVVYMGACPHVPGTAVSVKPFCSLLNLKGSNFCPSLDCIMWYYVIYRRLAFLDQGEQVPCWLRLGVFKGMWGQQPAEKKDFHWYLSVTLWIAQLSCRAQLEPNF